MILRTEPRSYIHEDGGHSGVVRSWPSQVQNTLLQLVCYTAILGYHICDKGSTVISGKMLGAVNDINGLVDRFNTLSQSLHPYPSFH